jgi:hypothetical protein
MSNFKKANVLDSGTICSINQILHGLAHEDIIAGWMGE